MRYFSIVSICLSVLITSCNNSDSEELIAARSAILGSWLYANTDYDCEFRMNFIDSTRFTESSMDEIQSGTYEVSEPVTGLIVLDLDIKEDNGQADCEGSADVDLEPFKTDLEFPDANTMLWINPNPVDGYTLEFGRVVSAE